MKPTITFLLIILFSAPQVYAQKCSSSKGGRSSGSGGGEKVEKIKMPKTRPFDVNHLENLSEKEYSSFRLGYGVNTIVGMNENQVNTQRSKDLSWFNDRVGHVFDVSGNLGVRKKWTLGFSFGFQKLGNIEHTKTYSPEDYLPSGSLFQGVRPLTPTMKLKARTYSSMLYTEYDFLDFGEHFSSFVRGELGMTIYRAYSEVNYSDTCGCKKVAVSDWEMSTALTAGLGVGLKWEYRFVGVKAFIAYQAQTKVKFKDQGSYANYSFDFDATNYDFQGKPSANKFAILKSGDQVSRSYNPWYIQFMLYFRIGSNK
jgi:hypothetical protein